MAEKMSAKMKKIRFERTERERLPQLSLRYQPRGEVLVRPMKGNGDTKSSCASQGQVLPT
jgi:hypothetical protein